MIDRYLLRKDWIIMSAPPRVQSHSTVSVIGAGRVGTALALALRDAGHDVVAVSTVSAVNRARVERLLPDTAVLPPDEAAAAAGIVILAVPDDALPGLVRGLAAAGGFGSAGAAGGFHRNGSQFVVHTSGAHGLAPLRPAAELGAVTAAIHPAMTFTGSDADLDRLTEARFGVTAEGTTARRRAARLVADLGGIPEWIAEPDRTLYHAALAHGANHLVTLVNEARDRLRDAGVRNPEQVLRPLLQAALDNSLALGDAALTGPVSRGDAGTVAGHLVALEAAAPASVPPYLALARRSADRAIAAGRLRPADAGPLLGVLTAGATAGTTAS
jgi:predicted short-subunit dehydrogenase-like oxidoreductase (DUF2520 family)